MWFSEFCRMFIAGSAASNDIPEMRETIATLHREKISFARKTPFQLKICDLGFYPGKGTIYRDGDLQALPERGLDSLLKLLRDLKATHQKRKSLDNTQPLESALGLRPPPTDETQSTERVVTDFGGSSQDQREEGGRI